MNEQRSSETAISKKVVAVSSNKQILAIQKTPSSQKKEEAVSNQTAFIGAKIGAPIGVLSGGIVNTAIDLDHALRMFYSAPTITAQMNTINQTLDQSNTLLAEKLSLINTYQQDLNQLNPADPTYTTQKQYLENILKGLKQEQNAINQIIHDHTILQQTLTTSTATSISTSIGITSGVTFGGAFLGPLVIPFLFKIAGKLVDLVRRSQGKEPYAQKFQAPPPRIPALGGAIFGSVIGAIKGGLAGTIGGPIGIAIGTVAGLLAGGLAGGLGGYLGGLILKAITSDKKK